MGSLVEKLMNNLIQPLFKLKVNELKENILVILFWHNTHMLATSCFQKWLIVLLFHEKMCSPGYRRENVTSSEYLGVCVPCMCHGHSNVCSADTGICQNCLNNTEGSMNSSIVDTFVNAHSIYMLCLMNIISLMKGPEKYYL